MKPYVLHELLTKPWELTLVKDVSVSEEGELRFTPIPGVKSGSQRLVIRVQEGDDPWKEEEIFIDVVDGVCENSIGMVFRRIQAGGFMMGSPDHEEGRYANEGPQH